MKQVTESTDLTLLESEEVPAFNVKQKKKSAWVVSAIRDFSNYDEFLGYPNATMVTERLFMDGPRRLVAINENNKTRQLLTLVWCHDSNQSEIVELAASREANGQCVQMNNVIPYYFDAVLRISYVSAGSAINDNLPAGKYSGVMKLLLLASEVVASEEIPEIWDEFYVNVEIEKK